MRDEIEFEDEDLDDVLDDVLERDGVEVEILGEEIEEESDDWMPEVKSVSPTEDSCPWCGTRGRKLETKRERHTVTFSGDLDWLILRCFWCEGRWTCRVVHKRSE